MKIVSQSMALNSFKFFTCTAAAAEQLPPHTEAKKLSKMGYCINENDNSFINACHMDMPAGIMTVTAQFVQQWVNPRSLALLTVSAILFLPLAMLSHVDRNLLTHFLRRFHNVQLHLLNFLHRVNYTLVLVVGLYAVFKQKRPCNCTNASGNFSHVGSWYGMPSGDAMSGALVGIWLMEAAPFYPWASRLLGLLVTFFVCFERVVLGMHSPAQVITGATLGFLLHIYSTRAPQWTIFVDTILSIGLGAISLDLDDGWRNNLTDPSNNLYSWYIWGVAFQLFVCLMIFYHFASRGSLHLFKFSLTELSSVEYTADEHMAESMPINPKSESFTSSTDIAALAGTKFTFFSFVICCGVMYMSQVVSQYGWLTKRIDL